MSKPFAIIVGAGPCGLLLALLLAKAGHHVQLLDAAHKLDEQPRATHYGPEAVEVLDSAGVLQDVLAEGGFVPHGVAWRKPDGTPIAELLTTTLTSTSKHTMVCLPLNHLGRILYRHLLAQPRASVLWGHRVTSVRQTDGEAIVEAEALGETKTLAARYVVGCDGANSQVRRSLFGDAEFPGWTWDEQIVATNTYYPFDKYGFTDSNFIISRENWYMAARISNDGLWRVTYGEVPDLTKDEYLSRQARKFEHMLPGNPKVDGWKCVNFSPYKIHQRLAPSLRQGKILLAGDAAHLCNPFGGLGLTGGILDVGGLYDCLHGIATGAADESILDRYSEVRSRLYREFTDPVSTANMRRLCKTDPERALEEDAFLRMIRESNHDPAVANQLAEGAKGLSHDFTQYYH
ncbi:FAD binding domain-containing protein [Colletotrichum karsti]|uniref:FAD binding domain-containing protein n=1 Tax=Colletotrichum karsti TaxID=1095194 RepID=A0A9P6IHI3_9PEZI|nr:FAD binding domain-containing protein [Colletotrichum karsti]KAF9879085.1 FAD binding domain-containing protein [Colletotrichum karsti]